MVMYRGLTASLACAAVLLAVPCVYGQATSAPAGATAPAVAEHLAALKAALKANDRAGIAKLQAQGKQIVPALIEGLKDEDWKVRFMSVQLLGTMGKDAAPGVRGMLLAQKDSDDRVRTTAVRAINAVAKSVVPQLAEAVDDKNMAVQTAAASALTELGPTGAPAAPALLRMVLDTQDRGWGYYDAAAFALAAMGEAAGDAVLKAYSDGDEARRVRLVKYLGRMGKAAIPAAVASTKDANAEIRLAGADALAKAPITKDSLAALTNLLENAADPALRAKGAMGLGGVGTDASIKALIKAIRQDKDPLVRLEAARAVGHSGLRGSGAMQDLIAEKPDTWTQMLAILAIGQVDGGAMAGGKFLAEILRNAQTPEPVRVVAAIGLGELAAGSPNDAKEISELLRPASGDADPLVKAAVQYALGQMEGGKLPVQPVVAALADGQHPLTQLAALHVAVALGKDVPGEITRAVAAIKETGSPEAKALASQVGRRDERRDARRPRP